MLSTVLLEGLSYFAQDLLNFTLVHIIVYLVRIHIQLGTTLVESSKNNMALVPLSTTVRIVHSLLLAESTPACVIELVRDPLVTLLVLADAADDNAKEMARQIRAKFPSLLSRNYFQSVGVDDDTFRRSIALAGDSSDASNTLNALNAIARHNQPVSACWLAN